ncbi:TonB-dependent receptor plug domain-containing protein [Thauera sp. 28]|uniref:TonB-dependent receptor plug domain-containing protein n=1 Tax=Thauera sp. 28 TaxID=303682 RepID=UPI00031492DA|nr:TonB-dependent receptor [Thauera sp. 28]
MRSHSGTAGGLALILTASLCAGQVRAEDSFFAPLPVVLSASRLPQTLHDSPAAVTVFDADFIAATGYRDLSRLMRLVPGFQVGQERGNAHWVTYHGLGMDYPLQMQVLIDGRSYPAPSFNSSAERISLQDIERIEVVRGSNSAAFGSNAFLGIVNIRTRHSADNTGTKLRLSRGAPGILDVSARHAVESAPLSLRISAQHEADEGFAGLHDGRRTNLLSVRGDLQLDERNELNLNAVLAEGRRDAGYERSFFNSAGMRESQHANRTLHLRWRHVAAAEEEWLVSAYWNRQRVRDEWRLDSRINPPLPLAPGVAFGADVGNTAVTDQHSLEVEHRWRLDPATRVLWGAEWRHVEQASPFYFHAAKAHQRSEQRLFANLEWRSAPAWLWNFGGMVEKLGGDAARFAPRVFLNWQAAPDMTWRLGHSRAWRQPGLFERNADVRIVSDTGTLLQQRQLPNPALRPQRIDAFELGFLGVLPDQRSTLDVRLFHERIDDLIVRQPGPLITDLPRTGDAGYLAFLETLRSTRWENYAGEVRLSGLEYQLRTSPWPGTEFILSHSMIDRRAADDRIRSNTAPYSGSLSWLQRVGPWQSMLSVLRMGPIDAGFSYVPGFSYTVPAYTTVDWSAARSFRLEHGTLSLRLSAINLLGRHQELANRPLQAQAEYRNRPANQAGRQVHVTLQAEF